MIKKKLLIFHPYLAPYRVDLYNRFLSDFELRVLLTGGTKEIATLGFDLNLINSLANFKYAYYQKGIRLGRHLLSLIYYKQIKAFKPNIVLAHELGLNTLFAIFFKKAFHYKLYLTIDDSPIIAMNYSPTREVLRRFCFKHCNGVLVVNPRVKDYLESKYPNYDCQFIYFPIIQNDKTLEQKLKNSEPVAFDYMKKYVLEGKKIVLYVGRLEKIKSIDVLIKALAEICKKDNTLQLVIVGKGSMQSDLLELVASKQIEKNVFFAGQLSRESLYGWYLLAHIFILPSNFEPFGAVVNEALVAGCFTVTSDHVGSNSLITEKNGLIFQANNVTDLKNQLFIAVNKVSSKKKIQNLMPISFEECYLNLSNLLQNEN